MGIMENGFVSMRFTRRRFICAWGKPMLGSGPRAGKMGPRVGGVPYVPKISWILARKHVVIGCVDLK